MYWETLWALTTSEGGILWQGVALVSLSVSLPHLHLIFRSKTLLYRILNQNYNILYLEHLIYGLYVCTCVSFLHQESFDMILNNNLSFYDGGVTSSLSCMSLFYIRYLLVLPQIHRSMCISATLSCSTCHLLVGQYSAPHNMVGRIAIL
jgi:hypothetical protein